MSVVGLQYTNLIIIFKLPKWLTECDKKKTKRRRNC